MNLELLRKTDKELFTLANGSDLSLGKLAKKEIKRRKDVGSWRLIANWKPEKEIVEEERVYAPGVRKMA